MNHFLILIGQLMVSIWAAEASTWKADVTKATQSFIDIALNFLPYKAL